METIGRLHSLKFRVQGLGFWIQSYTMEGILLVFGYYSLEFNVIRVEGFLFEVAEGVRNRDRGFRVSEFCWRSF